MTSARRRCARGSPRTRAAEPEADGGAALGEEEEEHLGGEWGAADELVDWVGGGSEHMVCFQALRKREEAKAAAAGGARRQLHVRLHIRYAVEKLVSFIHQSKNAAGRREQALFDGVVRRLVMVLGAQVLAEGKGAGDLDRQAFRAGSWRGGHCKTSLYEKVKKVAHAAQAADVLLAALLEEVVEELRARWVQAS